jgi:hypothetical protein
VADVGNWRSGRYGLAFVLTARKSRETIGKIGTTSELRAVYASRLEYKDLKRGREPRNESISQKSGYATGRLPPRKVLVLDCSNNPLAQIHRIRLAHPGPASPGRPPHPAGRVNLICHLLGITIRLSQMVSCSTIAGTVGRGAPSGGSCSRLCVRSRPARGAEAQAIGRSRCGRTTKIRAVCDALGRPIAIEVTPGQLGDVRAAAGLIAQLPPARQCAADTTYDSDALRQFLLERETRPVIPTTRRASISTPSTAKPTNAET